MPQSSLTAGERSAFQVLERTFAVLEVFSESRPEWSTTEIARTLRLPVPTAHRILSALKGPGYVSQKPGTRRFRLGIAALDLGERAWAVADPRPVAIGPLRRLTEATRETALLTVLNPERDRSVPGVGADLPAGAAVGPAGPPTPPCTLALRRKGCWPSWVRPRSTS